MYYRCTIRSSYVSFYDSSAPTQPRDNLEHLILYIVNKKTTLSMSPYQTTTGFRWCLSRISLNMPNGYCCGGQWIFMCENQHSQGAESNRWFTFDMSESTIQRHVNTDTTVQVLKVKTRLKCRCNSQTTRHSPPRNTMKE